MESEEFRIKGKQVIDYIADYLENIRDRRVFPDKKPGYIHDLLPECAPETGETWDDIFKDVESIIMPGVTHWQSPHMHAYFPAISSYPSMLGEMVTNAINCVGFTWASSPACTELEMVVMNWLGKMIGLPPEFLHRKGGDGGGVIQTTASDCTLISLLAGRFLTIKMIQSLSPEANKHEINSKLVAYCSDQAHSSVEKAALIGLVTLRYIESDEHYSMRGEKLLRAIKEDREKGLIPFWVCATLGTTGSCAFDVLEEISEVCYNELVWCHVDAAYAGSAFICPEYRGWLKGIEKANSIAFNPSKWLMVHFDCTAMWVRSSSALHGAFNVNPLYLTHEYSGLAIDYMHWQIPLSKRFRSLKLWFVIRNYGISGLQEHIRKGVQLAEKFENLVKTDSRFEMPSKRHLGLVVFRLVGDNTITEILCKRLNSRGKIHCVPASLKGKYVIRFTVTSPRTTLEDIVEDWNEIVYVTEEILKEHGKKVPLGEIKDKSQNFGSSLLLSNIPMSLKIVNGSFAAVYDQDDVLEQFTRTLTLRTNVQDSPAMQRRIKGILLSGKNFSVDSAIDVYHGIDIASNIVSENSRPENTLREDNDEELFEIVPQESRILQESRLTHSEHKEKLDRPKISNRHARSKSVDDEFNQTIIAGSSTSNIDSLNSPSRSSRAAKAKVLTISPAKVKASHDIANATRVVRKKSVVDLTQTKPKNLEKLRSNSKEKSSVRDLSDARRSTSSGSSARSVSSGTEHSKTCTRCGHKVQMKDKDGK